MSNFENENDQLLEALENGAEKQKDEVKRGTKSEYIQKIFQVCDDTGIMLTHTKTELKRMNKIKLAQTLADYIQKGVKQEMMKKVNIKHPENYDERQQDQLIALGTLKMIHNSLCQVAERGVDDFTDYSIRGYSAAMQDPAIERDLEDCLYEIAKEMEVLEHLNSPYLKLGMIHVTCIAKTLRQKKHEQRLNGRPGSLPLQSNTQNSTLYNLDARREKAGQEFHNGIPPQQVAKRI